MLILLVSRCKNCDKPRTCANTQLSRVWKWHETRENTLLGSDRFRFVENRTGFAVQG